MKALLPAIGLMFAVSASFASADSTPTPAAPAAPQQVAPAMTPEETAALAELKKTADFLSAADGFTYSAKLTLLTAPTGTSTVSTTRNVDSTVTVEKSGKFFASIAPDGGSSENIYADGANLSVYDSGLAKYSTIASTATFPALMNGVMREQQTIYPNGSESTKDIYPSVLFLSYYEGVQLVPTKNLPASIPFTVSSQKGTVNATAVDIITQTIKLSQATIKISFSIDPATSLPVAFEQEVDSSAGKVIADTIETFNSFQTLTTQANDSTFAFTPPAGATLVAAAPPPAPAPKVLANGAIAPDFTVNTSTGKPVKLSDFKGKVVVVDFWATWCPPCKASLPHTNDIAKKYSEKGVVFLPICSWDQASNYNTWELTHSDWAMPFYFDPAAKDESSSIACKSFGVSGIPTQFVIGKNGLVAFSAVGYDQQGDPTEKALVNAIDSAL